MVSYDIIFLPVVSWFSRGRAYHLVYLVGVSLPAEKCTP